MLHERWGGAHCNPWFAKWKSYQGTPSVYSHGSFPGLWLW